LFVEKYFPKESLRYDSLSQLFRKLDWLNTLKPERWFGVWTMVLAGSNISIFLLDRWSYWDWTTFNILIFGIILLISIFISIKPGFLHYDYSLQSSIFMFFKGIILFSFGTIPFGFDLNTFLFGLPYFIFFIVGHMIWSIKIDIKEKLTPSKKEMVPILSIIIVLTLFSTLLGYYNDDPMISTIAAVFLLFPIVILLFPVAIRHLQRARMHVIFISAMFISVRFPWFLIMIIPLFWLLRYYSYFRFGEVRPSFKVDLPTNKNN
jgi:hypothetical protein